MAKCLRNVTGKEPDSNMNVEYGVFEAVVTCVFIVVFVRFGARHANQWAAMCPRILLGIVRRYRKLCHRYWALGLAGVLVGYSLVLGDVFYYGRIQYPDCGSYASTGQCLIDIMNVITIGPLVVGSTLAVIALVLEIIRYRTKWNEYVREMRRTVSKTDDHDHDVIPDPNQAPNELIRKYVHVPRYNGEKSFVGAVVRACKIKFPRGVRSEAQSMAVSDYAVRYMKTHGHRTDHIARDLPMIVALYYLPSKHEVRAIKATQSSEYQDRLLWREQNRLL